MQLTAEQQTKARQWLAEGMKLSDFQKRLESEFGLRLTYMDVRLLVTDLQVLPKDPERPPTPPPTEAVAAATAASPDATPAAGGLGGVRVSVDTVTRPGAMVSGKVTFSDGQKATWLVDQYGRPGLMPETKGYRPSATDMQDFQMALEQELVKLGM
ncbi:MAG TPA: hypothetical protein PLX89_24235 [Verrucomicrobiota bacterium]|nr:hypothetical protein [Verrucomicrobiales bacterium]HRI16120.1 hypothetical protein [Verrucomicrobiota bacterium]